MSTTILSGLIHICNHLNCLGKDLRRIQTLFHIISLVIPCQEQMSAASCGLSPPKGQILELPRLYSSVFLTFCPLHTKMGQDLRLPFSRHHMQKKSFISDTFTKTCLNFKSISIYISYELIHVCLRPPRTPIPHAGLLSFLIIASV